MLYSIMRQYKSHDAYRRAWESAPKETPPIPLNIDIELTAICNLKCPFCAMSSKNGKNKNKSIIDVISAYDIMAEAANVGVPAIKFNWLGEPTMHPNFNLIMTWAMKFGFYDRIINTNGNYKADKNRGIMMTTKVTFSIDSFNSETYAKMRIGGDLKKVIENIKDLLKRGHQNVWARKTITPDNMDENFGNAAKRYFGDAVKVSEHHVFDRGTTCMPDETKGLNRIYCGYPSQRLVIDTNLNVYPCCVDTNKEMIIGKAIKTPIIEMWHSPRMKYIRSCLKKNTMPFKTCSECKSWMAYKTPAREKVKG